MPSVTVRFHTDDAIRGLDMLGRAGQVATRRALRRTATSVRALMSGYVSKDIGLRVGTVRDEIKLRINAEELVATISVSGARIPLIEFSARGPEPSRGKGRGVSYRIGTGGSRERLPHAFIATMASGHRGVFMRSQTRRMKGNPRRQAIVERFGPSLPHVFAKYLPQGVERAEEQLGKNLEHELEFALSQGG